MEKVVRDPVFGKCVELTNGLVELRVTLDYGPRIIYCACCGMENMLWQDPEKGTLGEKYDIFDGQYILYGGHRLWVSPEIVPRCYHPDNEPVTVSYLENGARFTAAPERLNGIQKSITVTIDPEAPRITVAHKIKNVGTWDIQLAPWAATMLAPGGVEVMPMPSRETGLLPNRSFTFWEYSELNDSRLYLGREYLTLTQDPSKQNPFKLGYNNEAGWAAYFNKGQVFLKYFEPAEGECYETYTNGKFLEMETLGEFADLSPEEFVTHEEEWELYEAERPSNPKDEQELKKIIDEV